jgi:hypothetical protein
MTEGPRNAGDALCGIFEPGGAHPQRRAMTKILHVRMPQFEVRILLEVPLDRPGARQGGNATALLMGSSVTSGAAHDDSKTARCGPYRARPAAQGRFPGSAPFGGRLVFS